MKANENGTPSYARLHKRGLTVAQQNAVDLLASGRNDTETAELLKLARPTVTKWRLYDPFFQAALNVKRAETWGGGADRLRALIPKALDVLAAEMEGPGPNRVKAAAEILRLAQLPAASNGIGPTDPDSIVRQVVDSRRREARGPIDDMLESDKGLTPFAEDMERMWGELEGLASGD